MSSIDLNVYAIKAFSKRQFAGKYTPYVISDELIEQFPPPNMSKIFAGRKFFCIASTCGRNFRPCGTRSTSIGFLPFYRFHRHHSAQCDAFQSIFSSFMQHIFNAYTFSTIWYASPIDRFSIAQLCLAKILIPITSTFILDWFINFSGWLFVCFAAHIFENAAKRLEDHFQCEKRFSCRRTRTKQKIMKNVAKFESLSWLFRQENGTNSLLYSTNVGYVWN